MSTSRADVSALPAAVGAESSAASIAGVMTFTFASSRPFTRDFRSGWKVTSSSSAAALSSGAALSLRASLCGTLAARRRAGACAEARERVHAGGRGSAQRHGARVHRTKASMLRAVNTFRRLR